MARIAHFTAALVLAWAPAVLAQQNPVQLEFVADHTTVQFTLGATLHTVEGTFAVKRGSVHFDPATGAVSGEIVVDATSGQSGNSGRDTRMHREILESAKFPEIIFRPGRVEGKLETQGASTLQVHGVFNIHGSDHEITIPVQMEMAADHWTASSHFEIPYVQWGIKNPSNFFLHVSPSVTIDIHASGPTP